MGLFDTFATSKALETQGVWLELDDVRIKLGRAGGANATYNKAAEKVARENKRAFELDLMSNNKAIDMLMTLHASTVVLDWLTARPDGELDNEGAPGEGWARGIERPGTIELVPPTVANILETFKLLPDLFRVVRETAEGAQFFRQSLVEGIKGN